MFLEIKKKCQKEHKEVFFLRNPEKFRDQEGGLFPEESAKMTHSMNVLVHFSKPPHPGVRMFGSEETFSNSP